MHWLSRYPVVIAAAVITVVLVPTAASTPAAAKSEGLVELRETTCSVVAALSGQVADMPPIPRRRVPIPDGSPAEMLLQELQLSWKTLAEDRQAVREAIGSIATADEGCLAGEAGEGTVGPRIAPLETDVERLNARIARLARSVDRWDAVQGRVAAALGSGNGLPKGHPPIDGMGSKADKLPSWHPPMGKKHGLTGSPSGGLPPGHPPIPKDYGSRVDTDVIEI